MADQDHASPTLELEGFLPYRLSVLANLVSRALAQLYEHEYGLTVAEWRLIAILARFGPLSANGVCERTAMDKVRVSRAVARASARKLISRNVDPQDRRRLVLGLTPQGRTIHDRIVPMAKAREAEILQALNGQEHAQLMDMLTRLQAQATLLADRPVRSDAAD